MPTTEQSRPSYPSAGKYQFARLGLLPRPRWGGKHQGVRKILKLMGYSEEEYGAMQANDQVGLNYPPGVVKWQSER